MIPLVIVEDSRGAYMTVLVSRKQKPDKKQSAYPSRKRVKYAAIPREWWNILNELGEVEDRSVSWYVRRAVKEYLQKLGKLPE